MGRQEWTEEHPLPRFLHGRAHDFELLQLLHLVERVLVDAAPLGDAGPARAEPVRLRPILDLVFPAGDIAETRWKEDLNTPGRLLITATFLGLYGSNSPLPAHFTEGLLAEQEDDQRVREFLDIFHHRVFSLLYRIWKKYRYYVTFRQDGHDPISEVIRGLIGVATPGLDERLAVPTLKLFRYAGLLAQRPRSAAGLVGQLRDYFQADHFQIEQCVGRWLRIQPNDRNCLGVEKCSLGQDLLLGEQVFDRSGKFRLLIGPLSLDEYVRFLPDGQATRELDQLVRLYCDDPLEYDLGFTLRGAEVPETPLGVPGVLGRLAWTSWLKSQPCADKSVIFSSSGPRHTL